MIRLRPVKEEDSDFLLGLRNTAEIRSQCFKNKIVNSVEHEKWFSETLNDPAWNLYVVISGKIPIGRAQVHKIDSRLCEISFALFPTHWGKGYGKDILDLLKFLAKGMGVRVMAASVKTKNERCLRLLQRYGFRRIYCGSSHSRFNYIM